MMVGTPQRIFLNISKRIVHPAHIPLIGKTESPTLESRNVCPRGRFLGDGHHIRIIGGKITVHFLEERNRFQALIVSINIGNPLAGAFIVIEIEHRSQSIYAQGVDMIFLEPVDGVGNQKTLYFLAPDIKAARTPTLVLDAVPALVFVKGLSVKFIKTVSILCKVRGHPIENNAYTRLVHCIHKRHKILWRAVTCGRRVISAHLISPRAIEGMLADGHQLHVCISHLLKIGCEIACKLGIRIVTAIGVLLPRTKMHLVNIERL